MEKHDSTPTAPAPGHQDAPPRPFSAAAARALAEAEERRRAAARGQTVPEVGGRDGPDPVRYGDWEVKGIASDF